MLRPVAVQYQGLIWRLVKEYLVTLSKTSALRSDRLLSDSRLLLYTYAFLSLANLSVLEEFTEPWVAKTQLLVSQNATWLHLHVASISG